MLMMKTDGPTPDVWFMACTVMHSKTIQACSHSPINTLSETISYSPKRSSATMWTSRRQPKGSVLGGTARPTGVMVRGGGVRSR